MAQKPKTVVYYQIDKVKCPERQFHVDIYIGGQFSPIMVDPSIFNELITNKGLNDFILNHGWTSLMVGCDKETGKIVEFMPCAKGLVYEIKIIQRPNE